MKDFEVYWRGNKLSISCTMSSRDDADWLINATSILRDMLPTSSLSPSEALSAAAKVLVDHRR